MTLQDSLNRTVNLVATAFTSIAGFAYAAEIITETDLVDKLDDALLLPLGIAALLWYVTGRNRFARSVVPIVLLTLGLGIKVAALIIESGDAASLSDDFGAHALFALALGLVCWLYYRARKTDATPNTLDA